MKNLLVATLLLPLSAGAQGFIEAVGTEQITGLENTCPAWSPDGSNVVQLTRNDSYDGTPVWTPDGRFIVFASERDGNDEVYRMRADGSRVWFNSNRSNDPATFALGNMDREHNHEIYSMTLAGDDIRRITDLPDWDTYPAISPDGTELLWRRIAPTGGRSESGRNSEVFWMNLRTGEQKNLTANQAYDGWPAWSPDGQRIAFASNRANREFEAFGIYVAEADGSNPTRITFGDGVEGTGSWTKPTFSADGKRILCTRTVGSSVDMFVITVD